MQLVLIICAIIVEEIPKDTVVNKAKAHAPTDRTA